MEPEARLAQAALRREKLLKENGIKKYNKRFRSWAQHRVRQYTLNKPVSLHADPSMMDAEYLTAVFQKAAALRKVDLSLWNSLSKRVVQVITATSDREGSEDLGTKSREIYSQLGYVNPKMSTRFSSFTGPQTGFIFWAIGKSTYLDRNLLNTLVCYCVSPAVLPSMTSHSVMALLWACRRTHIRPEKKDLTLVADWILDNESRIRAKDFMKMLHGLAFFGYGKYDKVFRSRISEIALAKFEKNCFAQDFRAAVNPLVLSGIYTDEVRAYILTRFRNIQVCARPPHLLNAYYSSVAMRVLRPNLWFGILRQPIRHFYTKLAQRFLEIRPKSVTKLHREVSAELEALKVAHRNTIRWGPFNIDIAIDGEVARKRGIPTGLQSADTSGSFAEPSDRHVCVVLDMPSSFFYQSLQYTEETKLHHRLLSELGWDVKRITFDEWVHSTDRSKLVLDALKKQSVDCLIDPEDRSDESVYLKRYKEFKVWMRRRPSPKDGKLRIDLSRL